MNEADLDGRVIIWALYQGVTSVDISVGKLKLVLTKSYLVKVEKERLLDWAGGGGGCSGGGVCVMALPGQ